MAYIKKYNYETFIDDIIRNKHNMSLNISLEQLRILLLDERFRDFKFIREDKMSWRGIILFIER